MRLPCTQVLRGLQNYAKYAAPPLGWGHVIFMPIFGSFDVIEVTWAVCLILIGREKFCCAVIGWDLLETPLLLIVLAILNLSCMFSLSQLNI